MCRSRPLNQLRLRRAFTLVELLVVIAIIGVLVAILLPAVQSAREAARRISCTNKVKQLGLALHNYLSAHKVFPPMGVSYGGCGTPAQGDKKITNVNGWLLTLPFLEEQNIHDKFNFNAAASNGMFGCDILSSNSVGTLAGDSVTSGNAVLLTQQLPAFTCPSDPGEPFIDADPITGRHCGYSGGTFNYCLKQGSDLKGAKTNYDFVALGDLSHGPGKYPYDCNNWKYIPRNKRRIFGENSSTNAADISDGLSKTLAVSETVFEVCNGECPAWGYRAWVMTGLDLGENGINRFTDSGWGMTVGPLGSESTQREVISWGHAASHHLGGCNVMLADGSVQFLDEEADLTVLKSMSTMAGNETVTTLP